MTITSTRATQPQPPAPAGPPWRRPVAGIASALILALVAGWGAYSLAKSPSTKATASTPVAVVIALQNGCSQWLAQSGLNLGSTQRETAWCQGMGDWLRDHADASTVAPSMWATADELRATCREWAGTGAPLGPSDDHSDEWCDSMATWMNRHTRDWSGSDSWGTWMAPMTRSMVGHHG